MNIAIWIIAICEVIRAVQNIVQIETLRHDMEGRDNAYAEFVKSLKQSDREYVQNLLKRFEEIQGQESEE